MSEVSMPVARTRAQQFHSLEWLRFLMALYIAIFHTFHYGQAPGWMRSFFELGFFGTSTFFLLSGFLLAHAYLRNPGSVSVELKGSAGDFVIKRLANLYPVHLGSLLLVLLLALAISLFPVGVEDSQWSLLKVNLDKVDWGASGSSSYLLEGWQFAANFLGTVLLLHAWNPFFMTLNIPSWSISALLFFYLLFPWISLRLHRLRYPLIALAVCNVLFMLPTLWVILTEHYGVPYSGILHRNPLIRLMEFCAGILLCSWFHQRKSKQISLWQALAMLVLIVVSLWFASWFMGQGKAISDKGFVPYLLLHNGLLMPAQISLIVLCIYLPNAYVPFKTLAKRLGNCSLTIFALHIPLHMLYIRLDRIIEGEPALCLSSISACTSAAGSANVLHYPFFVLILILSSLMFHSLFVERLRKKIELAWFAHTSKKLILKRI